MRHISLILLGLPLMLTPATALAQTAAKPTPAKTSPAPPPSDDDEDEIVVQGQRPPGSVVGDIPPEQSFSQADIRSYGVNNISDLIDELSPETTSGRGRGGEQPVVLLNGRRISSFSEIRDLPTEAILRVDILPEEVSLKYGYSADQKVINIVLRPRYRAIFGTAGATTSTDGGGTSTNPEANYVRIEHDNRFSINLRYNENAQLLESQRNVTDLGTSQPYSLNGNIAPPFGSTAPGIDPALSAIVGTPVTVTPVPSTAQNGAVPLAAFAAGANTPSTTDVTRDRTLKGSSQQFSANTVYARPIFARSTLTLNGSLSYQTGDSLRGLPSAALLVPVGDPFSPFADPVAVYRYLDDDPLHQRTSTLTGHGGVSLNGDSGKWRWSVTGNYDHTDVITRTQTGLDTSALQTRLTASDPAVNPFGSLQGLLGGIETDRARSINNDGNFQVVVGGPLLALPAGDVTTNIKAGAEYTGFDATSMRGGIDQTNDLVRRNFNGQMNLDVPITSRRTGVLPWFGNFTLNGNIAARNLSDFGTLTTLGGGFSWTPIAAVNLIGSYTKDEGAPTINQIGDPTIVTPQVRVFDYASGQTVEVSEISGGNRSLHADDRQVWKIGLTLKPLAKSDLSITASYIHASTGNAIATLPEPTADLENAFPDRFVRNADGDLIDVDTRAVNFERERDDSLRYGFNVSINLKSIIQKKFEAWIAARRAGKIEPPPVPFSAFRPQLGFHDQNQRRAGQQGAANGQAVAPNANGQQTAANTQQQPALARGDLPPPPPPGDNPPPPQNGTAPPPGGSGDGGPPPGGPGGPGGFGGPGGGGFGGPGGGGGFRGGGGGGRGGGLRSQAGGRLQVAVYDTWTIRDTVLIRQGVPLLDLLNGDAVGSGGGQSDHQVQLQLGYANNGIGVRFEGNYKTGSFVRGDGMGTVGDLTFSSLATFNLRTFVDLNQVPSLLGKMWARGLRISFAVNNIANSRQRVRDANGNTPLSYESAYLDPLGRTVSISIRKLIF